MNALTVLLPLVFLMTQSQTTTGPIDLTGKKPQVNEQGVQAAIGNTVRAKPTEWHGGGAWIWRDDQGQPPKVTRFRKTFSLSATPTQSMILASADVSYRLWINGTLVSRGPADTGRDYDTGAPGPWFDDQRDVSRFLKPGHNVIAAEVFPDSLVQSEGTLGHPGLKVDLRLIQTDQKPQMIATDETWKSAPAADLANHNGPNGYFVDLNQEPLGWQMVTFDDSHWTHAVVSAVASRPTITSELAPPLEAIFPSASVSRITAGVEVHAEHGGATFTRDGGYSGKFSRILSAYISLRVIGEKGARLLIMPNELDAPGFNRRAEIVLRDGPQVVELPFFDSFSTINIAAKGIKKSLVVQEVRATFTSYPVRYRGSFKCSDVELNRQWRVGRWVTQICMQTHHLDSPHHQEPISDPGDYLIEALNSYYAFGESALARQDLRKYARVLKARNFQSFHTSYSLLWLRMLIQYYDYTGDVDLVKELAPYSHALLDKFATYVGKNELISNAPNYMFMDWVEIAGFNAHHPPAVIGQGYMTALYYRALADDHRVAILTGDKARADQDELLRTQIKSAFNRELWSDRKGLYRDGKPHQSEVAPNQWLPADTDVETFSTQVNSFAVTSGLCSTDESREIMTQIVRQPNMNCQPYFMHFVFEALANSGQFETFAIAQMHRWKIIPDTQSFLEMWDYGDHSHAWNATNLFQMSGRILGVLPTAPGFQAFEIRPHPCDLTWAKGTVPTPHGDIHVGWKKKGKNLSIEFTVPPGTHAIYAGRTYAPGRHSVVKSL